MRYTADGKLGRLERGPAVHRPLGLFAATSESIRPQSVADSITSDSCGERIDRRRIETRELCDGCGGGVAIDLRGIPFREWPDWLHRATVRELLEARDADERGLRESVTDLKRQVRSLTKQLNAARRRAAEGLSEPSMERALRDVATNPRSAVS